MNGTMKRLTAGALGLASAFLATPSWAVFSGLQKSSATASVTFTGAGVTTMSILVKNVGSNAVATNITWSGVTLPFTANSGWKVADQYIELTSTLTDALGAVQIYTDNNNAADPAPKYTGTGVAAGLLDNTNTALTLPLAWAIKDTTATATAPIAEEPNKNGIVLPASPNAFQWLYFKDPSSAGLADLVPGEDFVTCKSGAKGMHFGQGPADYGVAASPDVIYIQGNFAGASTSAGGHTYSTRIRVESFTL